MRIFSYVLSLLVLIFGLTFSALNANQVLFNYYLGSKQISLAVLLVAAFGVGIVVGFMSTLFSILRLKREAYHLKSRLKTTEKELIDLRSLPLKEE